MQEQQLKARQLVLQQQAASAVAAASKTQREVCLSWKADPALNSASDMLCALSSLAGTSGMYGQKSSTRCTRLQLGSPFAVLYRAQQKGQVHRGLSL